MGHALPRECAIQGWLDTEPAFDYVVVPTISVATPLKPEDLQRFVRLYFPRTRKELVEDYDFIVFVDTNIDPFTDNQIFWLKDALEEEGLSGVLSVGGTLVSKGQGWHFDSWQASILHDILPIVLLNDQEMYRESFTIKIIKDDPPVLSVFRSLGIEVYVSTGTYSKYAVLNLREGVTTWAVMKGRGAKLHPDSPWMVSWRLGTSGLVWAIADDFDHPWWWPYGLNPNPYSGDVFLNMAFHSFDRELPSDIEVVHEARRKFTLYKGTRLMILGTIELAEKFGANTRGAEEALAELDGMYSRAQAQYAAGEYEESMQTLADSGEEAEKVLELTFRTKDQAMFYTYVIEWFATTGTFLLSGSILHALMIRRRLYKDVTTTKLIHSE